MYSILSWSPTGVVLTGLHLGVGRVSLTRQCLSLFCLHLPGNKIHPRNTIPLHHRRRCLHGETEGHVSRESHEEGLRSHVECMKLALDQARIAQRKGEVPVGAVLVGPDGHVLSQGHNTTEQDGDPTSHAEMCCIRHASSMSGGWRLLDCTLYVTLEPCPMCAGAILQSRVGTLVYGARNTLLGADGSWVHMFSCDNSHGEDSIMESDAPVEDANQFGRPGTPLPPKSMMPYRPHPFHPDIRVIRGVMADECSEIMKDFFRQRRRQPE